MTTEYGIMKIVIECHWRWKSEYPINGKMTKRKYCSDVTKRLIQDLQ